MPFRDRQVAELVYLCAVKRRSRKKMSKYSEYEYRKQPGFDMNAFEGANQAIPMKTLVIHCLDPRADEIPQAVAKYFGDEVYPGENILDKSGNRVGHTRTLFVETHGWTRRLRSGVRSGHGLYIQRSECRCGSPLVLRHNDSDARAAHRVVVQTF
jgi:hypothetical protein